MKEQLLALLKQEDHNCRNHKEWWQIMESTVTDFNARHGTYFDPTDMVCLYLSSEVCNAVT